VLEFLQGQTVKQRSPILRKKRVKPIPNQAPAAWARTSGPCPASCVPGFWVSPSYEFVLIKSPSLFKHVVDGDGELVTQDRLGLGRAMLLFHFLVIALQNRGVELGMDDDLREGPLEMGISEFAIPTPDRFAS